LALVDATRDRSRVMSGDNFSRRYSVVADARRRWSEAEKQAIVVERSGRE
jgi:hypothetical protein